MKRVLRGVERKVCWCGAAVTWAPMVDRGYSSDNPPWMRWRITGSVLSEAQIWGEKHSIPRSKRLPPLEQLSNRIWGRGPKMPSSTS